MRALNFGKWPVTQGRREGAAEVAPSSRANGLSVAVEDGRHPARLELSFARPLRSSVETASLESELLTTPFDPAAATLGSSLVKTVRERVMFLVRHAVSATANENEAHSAAMLVCRAIARHPTLLNTESLDDVSDAYASEVPAYGCTGGTAETHPPAKENREWEMFKRDRGIELRRVVRPNLCIACGQPYGVDEHVLQQVHVGVTHQRCAEWWRNYKFARVPENGVDDLLA
jgi:hypothetical protein